MSDINDLENLTQRVRLKKIVSHLQTVDELGVDEACDLYNISPATARRDFNRLVAEGKAEKTWGGIKPSSDDKYVSAMSPLSTREVLNIEEKQAIAREANDLIQDGEVVFIDGGSTTMQLAMLLASRPLKILTNSINISYAVDKLRKEDGGAEVLVTGGWLQPESGILSGPQARNSIQQYQADWVFLSTGGLDASGPSNHNEWTVEIEQAMMKNSRRSVILCDSSKLDKRALCQICSIDMLYKIIMDRAAAEHKVVRSLASQGLVFQFAK